MAGTGIATAPSDQLVMWAETVVRHGGERAKTVGLLSGSTQTVDGRMLEMLSARLADALDSATEARRLLVVHLDVFPSRDVGRAADQPATIPVALRSPLGPWSEVTIPMPVGYQASWSLEQLPTWLPIWKRSFDFVLISLGPLSSDPSRIVGRFCDECYLVLGPDSSASAAWIKSHLDRHLDCGNSVRGTLLGIPTASPT